MSNEGFPHKRWGEQLVLCRFTSQTFTSVYCQGDPHLCNLDDLHFLVLDEADRMVEYGHYRELGHILDRVNGVRCVS